MDWSSYREYAPHPLLTGLVRCYWVREKDAGPVPQREVILPDASVELMFYVGDSRVVAAGGPATPLPAVLTIGLRDEPLLLNTRGTARLLSVRFFPWSMARSSPFRPTPHQLIPHLQPELQDLADRIIPLVQARDDRAAIGVLDAWLLRHLRESLAVVTPASRAGDLLQRSGGQMRIAQIAAECGLSSRQVERTVLSTVGLPPKALARLIRFEQARDRIAARPDLSLTGLAYDLGYADQAHFIRDFTRLAGQTPGHFRQFARRVLDR